MTSFIDSQLWNIEPFWNGTPLPFESVRANGTDCLESFRLMSFETLRPWRSDLWKVGCSIISFGSCQSLAEFATFNLEKPLSGPPFWIPETHSWFVKIWKFRLIFIANFKSKKNYVFFNIGKGSARIIFGSHRPLMEQLEI